MPKIFGKYDPTEELTIRVHFETEDNAIDSRTLASILVFLKVSLDEIQREYGSTKAIAIQVRPFERGSFGFPLDIFQYDFSAAMDTSAAVAASMDFHALNEYVKTLIEIIRLKIELKGRKADKTEKCGENELAVISPDGTRIPAGQHAVTIYNNSSIVNYNINLTASALREDESVKEVKILDREGAELIRMPKSSFGTLEISDTTEPEAERSHIETVPLNIYQITFSEKHQWQFYYQGVRIRARIADEKFIEKVSEGVERFANGDTLICDLEIGQIFDKQANTYINRYYLIRTVHRHHPRADQTEMQIDG